MFTEQKLIEDYLDFAYHTKDSLIIVRLTYCYNLFCTNFGECLKFNLN